MANKRNSNDFQSIILLMVPDDFRGDFFYGIDIRLKEVENGHLKFLNLFFKLHITCMDSSLRQDYTRLEN